MLEIRALVIDDETSAQNTLIGMLQAHCPQVNVVGKADNMSMGVRLIETLNPDLVFLDIHLSAYDSGLDVVNRTRQINYGIIFVTAYSHYAVRAINTAQPWAYLVKPFSVDDLMEAVRTAGKKMLESERPSPEEQGGLLINDSRKGSLVLRHNTIIFCKAEHAVIEIACDNGDRVEKAYTYQSLKQILAQLPETQFCRVHHGFIVNLAYVSRVEKNGRGGIIHLRNKLQIPVSVKKIGTFEEALKHFLG